jgi:hypothetical protein
MFTLTPFGEINLAYATTTFAQPDPELPDYVNRAILVSTRQITEADRRYLIDGKDVQRLTAIYLKYYNNHALLSNLQKYGNYRAPDDYTNLHADVKRVAYSAIKQNKRAYAKFVYTNFVHYFRNFSPENRVSYPYLNKDFKYWEQNRLVGFFYSEPNRQGRFDGYRVNQISPTEASRRLHAIEAGGLHDAANALTKLRDDLFGSLFWVYLYIVAYLIILIALIKSRFNDTNAFLFFLIGSIPILSGILVSLVEISVIRYSITTEFVYYLLAFTLPLWFRQERISKREFPYFHARPAA